MEFIKKRYLSETDIKKIIELEKICSEFDNTVFKFELDFKYLDAKAKEFENNDYENNEFYVYHDNRLISYIGVCKFGNGLMELNGMTHPDYRLKGIFKTLLNIVLDEAKKRNEKKVILVCDSNSMTGTAFLSKLQSNYIRTEYEMVCEIKELNDNFRLEFVKATNLDVNEIKRQNSLSEDNMNHSDSQEDSNPLLPEEEEKRNSKVFLIKKKNQTIGKIHLFISDGNGWIFGFFIYKQFRGQGFGRETLVFANNYFKDNGLEKMYLQVNSINDVAYHLYKSFSFKEVSAMDYYELTL